MSEIQTKFCSVFQTERLDFRHSLYSKHPKTERSDFGHNQSCLVVKQFRFWTRPITEWFCSVYQTQNQFQTGSVRLSDVWDEQNDFKPNKILFGCSNRMFRYRTSSVLSSNQFINTNCYFVFFRLVDFTSGSFWTTMSERFDFYKKLFSKMENCIRTMPERKSSSRKIQVCTLCCPIDVRSVPCGGLLMSGLHLVVAY